ncbi:hypothetical protein CLAVI_001037 [Candidatus Clavichlamydia salmonicola]|nr:hypothetical protein [Candidatus Clavichlamydia salmonicola]
MITTLKHLEILSKENTVIINKNNILNIEITDDKSILLKDLSGPLSSLLYQNQVIFKEAFGKTHSKLTSYQNMMLTLKECIKIVKAFGSAVDSVSKEITSSPSHSYNMLLFILKPEIEMTQIQYHILYSLSSDQSLDKLIQLSKENIQALRKEVKNVLANINKISVFKIQDIKTNKKYLLKSNQEILSLLYNGIKETQLYLKKYHPTEFATHFCDDPSSDIHETLLLIERAFSSPSEIPVITQPHALESFLQEAIEKNQQLLQKSLPIPAHSKKILFQKKQNIYLFSINNIHGNNISNSHVYKFGYVHKKQSKKTIPWVSIIQEILQLDVEHMHTLCHKQFINLNIILENPLTKKNISITNAIDLYKLMYAGIQENLTTLTKTLPLALEKTTSYDIQQEYQNLLDTLTSLLGDHISEIKFPYILNHTVQQPKIKNNKNLS